MKRRRPEPRRLNCLRDGLWGAKPIPPRSIVRLKDTAGWLRDRHFRIGYYSRMDGLKIVWLVNEAGEYEQTVDQHLIAREFDVLHFSDETSMYGDDCPRLQPLVVPS